MIFFNETSSVLNMKQVAYILLEIIPPLLLYFVLLLYYVLCFASCFCAINWIRHLNEALIRLSFDVILKDREIDELQQDALRRIGSPWRLKLHQCNLSEALIRLSHIAYSTLPIMLIVMTGTVFWQKYIIYRTDFDCDPNDLALECFSSNASGPLTCEAVHELGYKFFTCYRLTFDLQTAAATAGGVFATSLGINKLLVGIFIAVRHTVAGSTGTILLQVASAVTTIVGFMMFALFYKRTGNPIDNAEVLLRAFAISYRIFFLCLFPWFRLKPNETPDPIETTDLGEGSKKDTENNYAWIPKLLQARKR